MLEIDGQTLSSFPPMGEWPRGKRGGCGKLTDEQIQELRAYYVKPYDGVREGTSKYWHKYFTGREDVENSSILKDAAAQRMSMESRETQQSQRQKVGTRGSSSRPAPIHSPEEALRRKNQRNK
jgi:hypothetical protein